MRKKHAVMTADEVHGVITPIIAPVDDGRVDEPASNRKPQSMHSGA